MSSLDLIQAVLGVATVGGVGGIWFRLGTLTEKQNSFERRLLKVEMKLEKIA